MPIQRTSTDFGPGASGTGPANVPGAPVFYGNDQLVIGSATNTLMLSYDEGALTAVTLTPGAYPAADLATHLQSQIDAALGSSCTVAYDSVALTYSIDVGEEHTIAYESSGSTAGDIIGFTVDAAAAQAIESDSEAYGSGVITFDIEPNGNGATVEYALYDIVRDGYLDFDGTVAGASPVWGLLADWSNGGADGLVTISGLIPFTSYTYRCKARNELDAETAWSSDSAAMNTNPLLDFGAWTDPIDHEVTTGNTRILRDAYEDADGNEIDIDIDGDHGDITATYTLQSPGSEISSLDVYFSEDYDPETGLGTWSAATEGSDGDGATELETSPAGVEHTFVWDSYTDAGPSEWKTGIYLKFVPRDAAGDPGATVITEAIEVNNRPVPPSGLVSGDGSDWSKDMTPEFIAIMESIRGGDVLFFECLITDQAGATVLIARSSVSVTGWEYEQATDDWHAVPVTGIPSEYADGVNRIRYTIPAGDALPAVNEEPYAVIFRAAEIRSRG